MSSANVTDLISVRLVSLGSFSKVKKFKQNIILHGLYVHDDARFSVGFLCRCCTTEKKFPDWKSHFSRIEAKIILYEIKLQFSTQKSHFGFEVKITPTENIQEFRSVSVWNVSICAQFVCRAYKEAKQTDQDTNDQTRGLQTERSFSIMQDFWLGSEAATL